MSVSGVKRGMLAGLMFILVSGAGCDESPKGPVAPGPRTLACLPFADQADGTADRVVKKCPACALAMEGRAEFKSTVGGYVVHSCSGQCQKTLEQNPDSLFEGLECAKGAH